MKTMTGKEFLRVRRWYSLAGYLIVGIGAVVGMAFPMNYEPLRNGMQNSALIMMLYCFLMSMLILVLAGRPIVTFDRKHPEMKFLKEWVNVIGSPDDYPVDATERSRAVMAATMNLLEYAKCMNVAIMMRECVRREIETRNYEPNGPEAITAKICFERLNEFVEVGNENYNRRWDLFVNDLDLLDKAKYWNPTAFRKNAL